MNDEVQWSGVVDVHCEGFDEVKTFVMRSLSKGDRVSVKILEAVEEFISLFHDDPSCAFIHKMPNSMEDVAEVKDGLMLFEAVWLPPRTVAVGPLTKSLIVGDWKK
jgi:hypothetical protein